MSKHMVESGQNFKAEVKSTIPKLDIDVLMSRVAVSIYLEVFSATPQQVVCIDSESGYEGLEPDQSISAYGFSKDGQPVFDNTDTTNPIYVELRGSKSGTAFLTPMYNNGLRIGHHKAPTEVIKGWNAFEVKLGCPAKRIREEISALVNAGTTMIFIRYIHNLVGLTKSFGEFNDDIIFSGKDWNHIAPDFNEIVNRRLLPRLESHWRVRTPELMAMLTARKNAKLEKLYGVES